MDRRGRKHRVNRQASGVETLRDGHRAYLIRIAVENDQERALAAFEHVREPVHSVAEDEFLVTGEHVKALRKAGVLFEDITESQVKDGKAAAG
jgi:hypothetical protein